MDQPDPAPATTAPNPRLPALDVVRGIAVLGILAANIVGMGQPMSAYSWPGGFLADPGPGGDALWAAQLVFVDGKFRGLFTLLFGAGMVLFQRRALARGTGGTHLLVRRLAWLAAFGLAHWALLWRGDILLTYALAGMIVLPLLTWPAERQFAAGLAGYLVGTLMLATMVTMLTAVDPADVVSIAHDKQAQGMRDAAAMAGTSYLAWVSYTLAAHADDLAVGLLLALFETVPLLLIGMTLVPAGLFDGRVAPRRQLGWGAILWAGGTAATAAIAAMALPGGIDFAESMTVPAMAAFPALASSLGLMAMLALWGGRSRGPLARRLAAAGRCAFSNYIGTSALALAVFSGWGLGLFGELGRLELYGVMLVFWAFMLAWPPLWLAHFRHGPLEWAWRCLTYGCWVPLR